MKHKNYLPLTVLLFLGAALLVSCQKDVKPSTKNPLCVAKTELTAPPGYKLEYTGALPVLENQVATGFQMLDDLTGYALAMVAFTLDAAVYKTTDGAQNWTRLDIGSVKNPINLHFINENVGFLSVFDEEGCPANCLDRTVLIKTEDGGLSWEPLMYPELKGQFRHMQSGPDGKLYAALCTGSNYTIMVSDDQAITWDVLYASPQLVYTGVNFTFKIFGDQLYTGASGARLLVLNKEGNLIQTIETGLEKLSGFERVSQNAMFVESYDETWRSIDGGNTWSFFSSGWEKPIGFISAQKVWMVRCIESCPSDVLFTNDVIALTTNGGQIWTESDVRTKMILNLADVHRFGPDDFLLAISNQFYRLRSQ